MGMLVPLLTLVLVLVLVTVPPLNGHGQCQQRNRSRGNDPMESGVFAQCPQNGDSPCSKTREDSPRFAPFSQALSGFSDDLRRERLP